MYVPYVPVRPLHVASSVYYCSTCRNPLTPAVKSKVQTALELKALKQVF